nr:hypothetical protein [Tanacetum cinerariifolium]
MIHDLDRFFNGVECVVDLDFIQRYGKCFVGHEFLQVRDVKSTVNLAQLVQEFKSIGDGSNFGENLKRVCVSRRHNSFLDDHYYLNSVVLLIFSGSLVIKSMAIFSHFQWGISGCTSKSDGFWFKLMVITKALTLGGLARSFLLRASAATFAFTSVPGSLNYTLFLLILDRVSSSSSNKLSVVGSRKLSPSPSASL